MSEESACTCELGSTLGLTPYLHARRYGAGEVLWDEGEESGRLIIVDQGRVKSTKTQADGRSVLLYVFSPGSVFGLLPFVDGETYPAAAIAVEGVQTREVSYPDLHLAIQREPRVSLALLRVLGKRLREAMHRVEAQSHHGATVRVAASLLLLAPLHPPRPLILDVPRPRYTFAADVGVTPESFSRALTRLVEGGVLLRLGGTKLQVLDLCRLEQVAAGEILL